LRQALEGVFAENANDRKELGQPPGFKRTARKAEQVNLIAEFVVLA
jgi:hypothetical protein